ncbi:hypothetical protein CQ395_17325 [Clostridium neonatale]|uniref:Uncharacterized protein n=1 Tax=Clostridium neonatale TaxID=137838 RepID=A0A2A7MMH7_9CLOT|nr:hypothetical protein CQ395_17325 [Clostridium neonatale]PEG32789.1 hypothetical protein CQ394_07405 [Clostridium neonatale]
MLIFLYSYILIFLYSYILIFLYSYILIFWAFFHSSNICAINFFYLKSATFILLTIVLSNYSIFK